MSGFITTRVGSRIILSDHQGMSIRAPLLFPEYHTPSTAKFNIDWKTFDAWNYNFITECELDAAVINGNWHEQPLEEKVNVFTQIQKYALDVAAMKKQVSNRGNTKPRWLVDIIKRKRRIQNGLRYLSSDTRIRTENAYIQLLQLDSPLYPTHYPDYQYNLWLTNRSRYKKETYYLGKQIIRHQLRIKKENWNEAISKIAQVDIKQANKHQKNFTPQ